MTNKTIIVIALAVIMVVGTLGFNSAVFAVNPNANDASPANGGVSNGLPFTNLQDQIDAINTEIDELVADNEENIELLQEQIDAINDKIVDLMEFDDTLTEFDVTLTDAIEALEDDVDILNNILGFSCGVDAIKAISSTGIITCISINEDESIATSTRLGPSQDVTISSGERTSTVSCLSGWTITGGGFDGDTRSTSSADHNGAFIRTSQLSGNGWTVTGNFIDIGETHGGEHFRAIAQCIKVL